MQQKELRAKSIQRLFPLVLMIPLIWFILSLSESFRVFTSSPVLRQFGIATYVLSFLGIALTLVLPLLVGLQLLFHSKTDAHTSMRARIKQYAGYSVGLATALAALYLIERFYPVSVTPFVTASCCILFAAMAWYQTRDIQLRLRIIPIACGLMVVLSSGLWYWNPRKPFLRDLFQVRIGMTLTDAQRTMQGYLDRPRWGDPPPEIMADDQIIYRPSNNPAYNADWGIIVIRDYIVVGVGFSPD